MALTNFEYTMAIFQGAASKKVIEQGIVRHYRMDLATRVIDFKAKEKLKAMVETLKLLDMEVPFIEIRWEYDGVGQGHYYNTIQLKVDEYHEKYTDCPKCDGYGSTEEWDGTHYRAGDCTECEGSGSVTHERMAVLCEPEM